MTVLSPKQMGAYLEAAQRRELLPRFELGTSSLPSDFLNFF